jgi:serine/threonine protein kinase
MLTGELPFTADNSIAVCMKHVNEPPRPPKLLNPNIPEGMNALVLMLLAKHPTDRYGSAMELMTDLERVRDGLPPTLALQATTQPLGQAPHAALRRVDVARRRRTSWTLAVAAVAMVALLGTFLFGLLQDGSGEGALPRAQGFAREILDPPAKAAINTTKTGARTENQTGATPEVQPSASAASSPTPSTTPSPVASPERPPVVPAAPPEDQTPAELQYGVDN